MRPFFLYLKPSERERKPTTQPTPKANPQSQESRQGRKPSRRAGRKQDKRTREENERTKGQKAGQTRNKPQNRLTIHAHKNPTSHAKTSTHKIYIRAPKPAKNPLKMRNKAIFQANTPQAKQTSDQKAENTPKDRPKPCIFAPSGHDHRPKERVKTKALHPQI